MRWNGNPGAGFTTGDPWLPIPASAATVNVADQLTDPSSLLTFYRDLIHLRRDTVVLRAGAISRAPLTLTSMPTTATIPPMTC
jgi:trehalose-6-phosphate hydrolase